MTAPDPTFIRRLKDEMAKHGQLLGIPVGTDTSGMKLAWRADPMDADILYPGNTFTLGFAPLGKDTSRLMDTPFTKAEARAMGERWVEWGGEA